MDIFSKFGKVWKDEKLGFGINSYNEARAAGLTNQQILEGLSGKRIGGRAVDALQKGVLSDITTSFESQVQAQREAMDAERQRYQEEMKRLAQTQLIRQSGGQAPASVKPPVRQLSIRPNGGTGDINFAGMTIKSINI